jgi:hypothetical protein
MRKLHAATGGQPQRWESLGNLGSAKSDAAGIAYAIERDWLIISGGLHSVSLTKDGRRRLKSRSVGRPRRRSGARRQVELGVLERLLDRRNAGGVTRLALRDADLGIETLRRSAQPPILVEIGFVLASEAAGKANAAATTGRTPLMKVFIAPLQC